MEINTSYHGNRKDSLKRAARILKITLILIIAVKLQSKAANVDFFDNNFHGAAPNMKIADIEGQVKDIEGNPIPGATVSVKGTNNITQTDIDGRFRLSGVNPSDVLMISFLGFKSKEITVSNATSFNISLESDSKELSEVVVVGYGTQKKINLTGSIATVDGDVYEGRPITSVSAGLQGTLPGVTISSNSGQPGSSGTSIQIRGITTLNSGSEPLILIDGVAGGTLDMLNPQDVESVTVLKDAASSAIYGARAANGVILITTKSGKQGMPTTVSYTGYVGFQSPTTVPELVSGRDFMTLSNEARQNAGLAPLFLDAAFAAYDAGSDPNNYSNTDWISEVYKKSAAQTNHVLSLQGGSGKTGYFMSYGYLDQGGLVVGDAYNVARNNVRLRVNTEVFDRLKLDGNISFVNFARDDNAASGTAGEFRLANRISPLLPVKWYNTLPGGGFEVSDNYSYGSVSNPIDVANNSGFNNYKSATPNANLQASLRIIDGLNLNGQYSFNNVFTRTKIFGNAILRYNSDGAEDPANATLRNSISESRYDNLYQTFNYNLNYTKSFGNHNLSALAGYSQEWGFTSWVGASRQNITLDGLQQIDLGTEDINNNGSEEHFALRSFFGRLTYNYKEKYLFEANVRRDGTSRFSANQRWGTFPSFSAGWRLGEEPFMQFIKSNVDELKIRASYGELGNQNVGSGGNLYPYLTSISRVSNAYPIGNSQNIGFAQASLGNSSLMWESIKMTNIGLDLAMLRNRFSLTADWFVKNNDGALLTPIYPAIIGFTSVSALPLVNMGNVQSKGYELSATWRDKVGEVDYGITANFSDVKNKVVSLGKSAPSLGETLIREGDPLGAYFGYQTDGLAQASDFSGTDPVTGRYINPSFPLISSYASITQPGDVKYRDISGPDGIPDGRITSDDRVIIGDPNPRYTYSFRGELGWKGIDLSFYLQGIGKVDGYLYDESIHAFINDYSTPQKNHLDRWTPNNTDASYPRVYYAQSHNREFSDFWIQNASYFRLKNIQIGYTLPTKLTQKARISKSRIFVSADNLFTATDYFYAYDPELRSTSGDAYPQVKTVVLGLSLTFK